MDKRIVISLEELVSCPDCGHQFALREGINRQTIERYENELNEALAQRRKEIEVQAEKDADRRAAGKYEGELKELRETLAEQRTTADEARSQLSKARADAREKALQEASTEKKALLDELQEKGEKLRALQAQELELRAEKRRLEEAQREVALEVQRKVDQERAKVRQDVEVAEAEKFKLKEAELRKQIEDAKRANEELSRKLDQKSQQLQGEVLEIEVEHTLSDAFRHDSIEQVKKGVRGADVVQIVRTPAGETCGKIIWEAKRAENWSEKWLQKLKDDQQEERAEVAVLVTTAMPRNTRELFVRLGDVWVVSPEALRPFSELIRATLVEAHGLRAVNSGRAEKMELLYAYLSSPQFAQRMRSLLEAISVMRLELEAEKRAVQRIWAKRDAQLTRVAGSLVTVCGDLQGIAQGALPELETVASLELLGEGGASAVVTALAGPE